MHFSGVREERFKAPLVPPSPPRYGTSPQFGASTLKFEHTTSLDATFNKLVFEIQQRLDLVAKAPKIRLETWLRKLHEPESNNAWKKNRNNYARLLLASLKVGRLDAPFDKVPEEGRLKMLPKHALYGLCAGEKGGGGDGRPTPPQPPQPPQRREIPSHQPQSPTARASLEDLLRKAEVATAGTCSGRADITKKPGTRGASTRRSRRYRDVHRGDGEDEEGDDAAGEGDGSGGDGDGGGGVSGGSSERRGSRRGGGFGGGASGRGGSGGAVELEAELGACRERCKELEWKLTRANTSLEHQTRELSQARAALLTLQKAKGEEVKELRRSHRKELDEMIVAFEKRRSEWAPRAATALAHATAVGEDAGGVDAASGRAGTGAGAGVGVGAWGGNGGKRGGKIPAYADPASKDGDFFNYLEKFQKQTEQLRHHLDPSAAPASLG